MGLVDIKIDGTQTLSGCIRCSGKRRDLFNDIKVEVKVPCALHCLDIESQWFSTFNMLRKCIVARRILSAVVS